ncbi:MAG: hypothetical protein IJ262_02090 [Clostridia bacterium]|nr:hypothetical protein [Clostridia bacterium]
MSDNDRVSTVHFTYKENLDQSSLCQGDLLEITDELKDVLKEIHPYFLNEQYKYFMVLTQSCDLVRRKNNKCKTPYITLAAVRSFDDFFESLLLKNKYAECINGLLFMDSKNWEKSYQLLERMYNNTEPDYFFLYKDGSLGLTNSMIASLKVSIALKSELHYDKCLSAKVLELSDEFKAKLGWLVGNIYSRVGTTDWESIKTSSERKNMLTEELQSHCIKGEKSQINALKKELEAHEQDIKTAEDALAFIKECHIESKYDQVISVIEGIIASPRNNIPDEEKSFLIRTIKNTSKLKTLIPN